VPTFSKKTKKKKERERERERERADCLLFYARKKG
jgi:hypothetical protein